MQPHDSLSVSVGDVLAHYDIGRRVSVEFLSRRWTAACREAGFAYQLRDIRAQALTDEFLAGADGTKGGHKMEAMREHYRRVKLPLRARNTLRRIGGGNHPIVTE